MNSKRLRDSAICYWSVNDMDLSLKKQIMQRVHSPEWEHNQTLLRLLETRRNLDEAIADLISIGSIDSAETVEFEKKLLETRVNLSKTLESNYISDV